MNLLRWGAGILLISAALLLLVHLLPEALVGAPDRATDLELVQARNDVRTTLVQLLVALLLLVGAVYTVRTFTLNRQGQFATRYTQAIDQLASEKEDVRIGGLYALERISKDSPRDYLTVIQVFMSFIRGRSERRKSPLKWPEEGMTGEQLTPDAQTALHILGRRGPQQGEGLYLQGLQAFGANFQDGDWRRTDFSDAVLPHSNFFGSDVSRSSFDYGFLMRVKFDSADARNSFFRGSRLEGTAISAKFCRCSFAGSQVTLDFTGADLAGADFGGFFQSDGVRVNDPARLGGSDFRDANLQGVNFEGVDLSAVSNLKPEQVADIVADADTTLPSHLSTDNS